MVVIYFMIWALGVSNIKPLFLPYTNLPELMICGHLSFSINDPALTLGILPFNEINSYAFPFSINGQDILRVFGLLKSQISNLHSGSDDPYLLRMTQ
jgi:hypothetical protein